MEKTYCYYCSEIIESNQMRKQINEYTFIHAECFECNKFETKDVVDDDVSYCVNCNKIVETDVKCLNEGFIHNCISMSRKEIELKKTSNVNHPKHYGGENNIYEAIKIIEHYKFGFCIGNAIKYILRAGKKDETKYIEDLEKAAWYLNRKIEQLKNK